MEYFIFIYPLLHETFYSVDMRNEIIVSRYNADAAVRNF